MPVDAVHADYERFSNSWRRVRDVLAGEDAVKAAGERYVARIQSQSDAEFAAYVARGFFYNATARTVAGYEGMIFRKPVATKLPHGDSPLGLLFDRFADDVDLVGTTLTDYARVLVHDVLAVGRAGTLVDWQDAEKRAYLAFYGAEDILNWRCQRIDGRLALAMVVLRERVGRPEDDGFGEVAVKQLRVLRLVPGQSGGWVCRVELWQQLPGAGGDACKPEWSLVSHAVPLRLGLPLPAIPFVFHGPTHDRAAVERSPVDDIVAANLDHYRINVDFKHGMHFTALPTAWVSGFPKETSLKIGAAAAWCTEQLGATAGYLEFRGEGLMTFERALDRVERLLTVLGSRLLESQKRVSESAEALAIRQGAESSILANLARAVGGSLTDVLRWVYWWHSTEALPANVSTSQVRLELNTDFETALLSAKEIDSLVAAWQAGALSRDSLHHQFERGELLPPGRTLDEEIALVKAAPPPAVPAPVAPPVALPSPA